MHFHPLNSVLYSLCAAAATRIHQVILPTTRTASLWGPLHPCSVGSCEVCANIYLLMDFMPKARTYYKKLFKKIRPMAGTASN